MSLTLVSKDSWTSMRRRRHLSEPFELAQGKTLVAPLRRSSITFQTPAIANTASERAVPSFYSIAKTKAKNRKKEALNLHIKIRLKG